MKHYLSSTQVAEHLGMTRDALNGMIRADAFISPDVTIGGRFQGWSIEAIEKWAESSDRQIQIDTDKLFGIVTSIRRAAERIRAFSRSPEGVDHTSVIVPSDLHVLAARLEAETRSWLEVFDYSNRRFIPVTDATKNVHEISVELASVPTLVCSPGVPPDIRRLELHFAADELAKAAGEIHLALTVKSSRNYQDSLMKKATQIHEFADELGRDK